MQVQKLFCGVCQGLKTRVAVTAVSHSLILGKVLEIDDKIWRGGKVDDNIFTLLHSVKHFLENF